MTTDAHRMAEPEPPIRAFRILALCLLASTLVFLISMVALVGMGCTAILGPVAR